MTRSRWHRSLLQVSSLACCVAFLAGDSFAVARTVDVTSTGWSIFGKSKGSLSKIDKWGNPADEVLAFFGPLDFLDNQGSVVFSLPGGMFLAGTRNLNNVLIGDYQDDGKGKLSFSIDPDALDAFIEEMFEMSIDDTYVDIQSLQFLKVKATGKAKASKLGDVLKLKLGVKFIASGTAGGYPGSSKGSFTYSGVGLPMS